MQKTKSGFTIVELLIVIVVIAILASISIVAYSGIQVRARNVQQAAAAKSYIDLFASYVALNGSYPPISRTRTCLNLSQSACVNNTAWDRDTTLETALKTVASSLPSANTNTPSISTPKMGYVPSSDVTLDGVINPFLTYTVESPGTCTVGSIASGVWPNYNSTTPAQGYTASEGSVRLCIVPLPRT